MKKFLIQHYCPPSEMHARMDKSPEEMQSTMQERKVWIEACGEMMLDPGAPLINGSRLRPDGGGIRDERSVSGYMIMQGESKDAVIEKLNVSPLLQKDTPGYVDIYEMKAMG